MNRTQAIFVATGALIVVGALVFKPSAHADAPRVPASDGEVLERLPRHEAAERQRGELRKALVARPDDLQTATWLARLDIEASRKRADPRYLGQAQAALEDRGAGLHGLRRVGRRVDRTRGRGL